MSGLEAGRMRPASEGRAQGGAFSYGRLPDLPSSIVIPAVPNQGQGRLQGDKKLDGIAHWLADKAKTWGIDITAWHACADSHRQSEMAAMGPNAPACQHTSPAWQNLQNMQSTVACALLVAFSTCQLPSTPMGAGARRSSTSSSNRSSTACVQRSGRQPVAQSGTPLQSGSSCSSAQVWQLQEGTR